jgi:hypothetical protein
LLVSPTHPWVFSMRGNTIGVPFFSLTSPVNGLLLKGRRYDLNCSAAAIL